MGTLALAKVPYISKTRIKFSLSILYIIIMMIIFYHDNIIIIYTNKNLLLKITSKLIILICAKLKLMAP